MITPRRHRPSAARRHRILVHAGNGGAAPGRHESCGRLFAKIRRGSRKLLDGALLYEHWKLDSVGFICLFPNQGRELWTHRQRRPLPSETTAILSIRTMAP